MPWFIRRSDLTFGGIRRLLMEKGVREERGIEVGIRWWIGCETYVEFVFFGLQDGKLGSFAASIKSAGGHLRQTTYTFFVIASLGAEDFVNGAIEMMHG